MVMKENCPICNSTTLSHVITCEDHSVSGEEFNIVACGACGFQFTNPVPSEEEIGAYYKSENYVSHSSSKKGIINRIYHLVRWYSLRRKVRLIRSLTHGRRLLDIGAGTGHFLKVAKEASWVAQGLEPDGDARALAKSLNGVDLQPIGDLHGLESGSFDVITMWHVLEHVYHLQRDFAQVRRLMKPGGHLVIAVPNRNSFDARYYREYWAAYDVPIHLYHFTKEDIRNLADQHGLELIAIKPMIFDAFYVSMLSEKYRGGSVLKGALIGLKSNWLANEGTYSSQIYILRQKSH